MGSSSKKPRAYYNPETKRTKKKNKNQDLVKQMKVLQARLKKEGETKWLKNAAKVLTERMRKAGLIKKS